MKEVKGDFWAYAKYADAICVTTNGTIKANGELVMGKGLALAFARRYPELPLALGNWVKEKGNVAFAWGAKPMVISFPTKENWWEKSPEPLIWVSARGVVELADLHGLKKVLLTRAGCGLGGLDWETQVRPILQGILDDRFVVVSK